MVYLTVVWLAQILHHCTVGQPQTMKKAVAAPFEELERHTPVRTDITHTHQGFHFKKLRTLNPLNPELNPICYLLALLAHHFLHVSRIMVKSLTLRLLMSYIYGGPILDVSRSHTMTQHSR